MVEHHSVQSFSSTSRSSVYLIPNSDLFGPCLRAQSGPVPADRAANVRFKALDQARPGSVKAHSSASSHSSGRPSTSSFICKRLDPTLSTAARLKGYQLFHQGCCFGLHRLRRPSLRRLSHGFSSIVLHLPQRLGCSFVGDQYVDPLVPYKNFPQPATWLYVQLRHALLDLWRRPQGHAPFPACALSCRSTARRVRRVSSPIRFAQPSAPPLSTCFIL